MHSLKKYLSSNFTKRLLTSFFLGAVFWSSFIYFPPILFSAILLIILLFIVFLEFQKLFDKDNLSYWLVLPFYPILPFILLIIMNQTAKYHDLLLELFVIVASFDTGSYIAGTLFGKHKVIPWISPKKSWEGVIGGYAFATAALFGLVWYERNTMVPWWILCSFTFIICALAFAGDLFESFLKRRAHIKHSGGFLPGHGGFLDRFDGIMFAVFFFYIFKDQLVQLFG